MGQKLHNRIEIWKKLLLDFGKRNRLINFLEGKRSNVMLLRHLLINCGNSLLLMNERSYSRMPKKYKLMMMVKKYMKP